MRRVAGGGTHQGLVGSSRPTRWRLVTFAVSLSSFRVYRADEKESGGARGRKGQRESNEHCGPGGFTPAVVHYCITGEINSSAILRLC